MSENDRIIDMARAMARAIQMDERYLAFQKAREESDADTALQEAIGQYNIARMNLNEETAKTEQNGEKVAQYNDEMRRAYDLVMESSTMKSYDAAQHDINALITYINAIITTAINGGDPDEVHEPSGCGDGCDSCSGCH